MGRRVLACRALTQKKIQCANPIGCWHHSCKDDGCHRRQPHTAHNIPRVPHGTGEKYVLDQSEKARRAANHRSSESEDEQSTSDEASASRPDSGAVDGDLLHGIEESREMANVEDNAELIRVLLEHTNPRRDTATQTGEEDGRSERPSPTVHNSLDNERPAHGPEGIEEEERAEGQDGEREEEGAERRQGHGQIPLGNERLADGPDGSEKGGGAEGRRGEGEDEGAGRRQRHGHRESSLDLLLREFPDVLSPTVAEGSADTSSGSLPELADAVSQDTVPQIIQHQRERRDRLLPRTLSLTDEIWNNNPELSFADQERYILGLTAAQDMVSRILQRFSAEPDGPQRDVYLVLYDMLSSAEPMLYYRASIHGRESLQIAKDCLVMLHGLGDGTNHLIREKIDQALSILNRVG